MRNAFILKGGGKEHWSLAAVPGGCKIKTSSEYVVVRTSFMNNLTIASPQMLKSCFLSERKLVNPILRVNL